MTTIYSLAFVKRYIVYANEQHINLIRCKNIKLYFFSRNRATILKQVRFDSVNRTNIAFRANQKQTKVPWDSQKKKANRNGICINLYKQDHLVYSYICHFLYACRISIYKNANFSLEMWNILEAVLKKICWQFSRKWVLEKRLLFVFSFVFACLGRRSFTRVMRLVCTCICHRTFCICICICLYLFDFACLGSGSVGKVMSLVCCHRHDRHTQVYPERKHRK